MSGNLLARLIDSRIAERAWRPDALELGTIQPDMSLLLDRFQVPIPDSGYLVCRSLRLADPMVTTAPGGGDAHTHQVPRPAELAALVPGDRVLVAWVNNGSDPVVIDVVS